MAERVRVQTQERRLGPWVTVDGTLVPAHQIEDRAQRFRAELGTFLTVDLDSGERVEVDRLLVSGVAR